MRIPLAGNISTKDGATNKNSRLYNVLAETRKDGNVVAGVRPGLNRLASSSGDGNGLACFNGTLVNLYGTTIYKSIAGGGYSLDDPNTVDTSRDIFSNFTGAYVDQFVITKGHARYTGAYSPECLTSGTDSLNAYVVMRLRFEGADGSTSITDDSGHTITNTYSNQIKTDQFSCGASSLKVTSGGLTFGYSSDFSFGSGDFCIEFKVRFYDLTLPDLASDLNAFGVYDSTPAAGYRLVLGSSDETNIDSISLVLHGVSIIIQGIFSPLSANTWYAFACSNQSGVFRLFLDGALLNEVDTGDYTQTSIGTVTNSQFDFALIP